ncbi:hypothetical protein P3X46_026715 [Hevea brasiliensis]|uniref:NPH3 domain-containing protein n=1 Tax=Hevea brasiliensis TaxID=3981 RepID=A0ABQ9KZ06_HEVBR|nr:hypothetical protein P3X46_026715 [Hevea brasiliensis]
MQAHPTLSFQERTKICRCLNYEKLSLEACKELARNPRIPPTASMQALISQKSHIPQDRNDKDMKVNIDRMLRRVMELEKVCKEMKGQMSWLVKHNPTTDPFHHNSTLPRLC